MVDDIRAILKQYWGYDHFREVQEDVILSVLAGNDTLALLPTGGGKSICFQVPAMAKPGMCLVISPLIALMKDQVEQLKKRKIPAAAIFTGMHGRELEFTLSNAVDGQYKFLYVSPERLNSSRFKDFLINFPLNLVAVDEAHCISQWGYDFRPAYLQIAQIRSFFTDIPFIALTASATPKVQLDIIKKLQFKGKNIFQKSFARNNLSYACIAAENKIERLTTLLHKIPGSAIVYTGTRNNCKNIADQLINRGISADFYHAGLSLSQRNEKQQNWLDNRTRVMVCTNAFGMGIDKPDVRLVVHDDLPTGLEAYYQEAGRAGRDGQKAYAILLYNQADILQLREKVQQAFPEIKYIKNVYAALAAYYQLAVGSSPLIAHNFDLLHFCQQYNFKPNQAHVALKRLEWAGLITLNDAYHRPSKIWFTVSNTELYEFQLYHPRFDKFIKLLLRMYGGELFTRFVQINENQIAANSQFSNKEVGHMLEQLQKHEILLYEPQSDSPQVVFNIPVQDIHNMDFDEGAYRMLKTNETERMQNMLAYVANTTLCRQQVLVEYFGDVHGADCMQCDVCQDKIRKGEVLNYQMHKNLALKLLNKTLRLEQLAEKLPQLSHQHITNLVQRMAEEGLVTYDTVGNSISLKK